MELDTQHRAILQVPDDADLASDKDAAPEDRDDALSPEQQKQFQDARDQFLADHVKFEDTPDNWDLLFDWLDKFSPPLPLSPAALALSYEQTESQLELLQPPDESSPEIQEALQDHEEKQREREEKPGQPATISQAAKQMAEAFRKRGEMVRFKNGKRIDGGFGS